MILVTGATGKVGTSLVNQLLAKNQRIRILVRDPSKAKAWAGRLEMVQGDLTQAESLTGAMRGIDQLFTLTIEKDQMQRLIDAAKAQGVKHVVKLSTLNAGEPMHAIDKWHHAMEDIVLKSGLEWTFLRPGAFMANTFNWKGMIAGGTVFAPTGSGKMAPIASEDIAEVAAKALTDGEHVGKAYQLTGPELLSAAEQVEIIARVLEKPLKCVEVSPEQGVEAMRAAGMPPPLVDALNELNIIAREGRGATKTEEVKRLLGHPAMRFEEFVRAHRQEYVA